VSKSIIKWKRLVEEKPLPHFDILFMVQDEVFAGWQEALDDTEDMAFWDAIDRQIYEADQIDFWSYLDEIERVK
jgi:hypothetical protein